MTTPFICVFLAFLLLYVTKVPVAVAMNQLGGYDNHHPRDQQAKLQGWGRRALAAHLNAFENFPGFAAGVLIAHAGGGNPQAASLLSIAYVAARVLYTVFYIADIPWLRSTVWFVGVGASGGLMLLPLFK
ncbi:MAG: hypothetical protein GMKNLPBB_02151 [Myxococcota bacterium]|nr:hypothetical protein [Myxococcota bacterium]